MRGQNFKKFLRAIDALSRRSGVTIHELQEILGRDRTSVSRLIRTIEDLDFPVREERHPDDERVKIFKLEDSFVSKLPNISIPNLHLSPSELISLYLLRAAVQTYKGTDIETTVRSAFCKLDQFLPENFEKNISRLRTLFIGTNRMAKDYSGKEAVIDDLTRAILNNKVCRVRYLAFYDDTEKTYLIEPLHFFESKGGLYLFVRVPKYDDIRVLAVERIQDLNLTKDTFEYPEDFDPEERLSSSFDLVWDQPVQAKIWFSAPQAKYIRERRYSQDQTIHENPDGSIVLELNTSGWHEVIRWILSFGPDAEVLEPKAMREEIKESLRSSLARYRD
jgi:predicted DNA-binding transcriptional regulator YafY